MNKLSTQPYKGARDFYPEDKRIQNYMFSKIRETVRRYGYEEYDAPILESIELYRAKSGTEIVNEQTYSFTDRGGREVAIRPEMTPTVSRMVAAKRQELAYPLRWFSIPNLWRYERPQRGRLREHWQLNLDMFGEAGIEAEFELISVANAIMKSFGAKQSMYTIKINSRKLIDYTVETYLGLDGVQSQTICKLIDRMNKMDHAEFVADVDAVFSPSQREDGRVEKLLAFLSVQGLSDLPEELTSHESVLELRNLMNLLSDSGITNAVFDPSIMRGFDYYTGIVFEMNDNNPENNRAMFGGGRYDGLVGLFGVDPVPTVGLGWGDVTMANFLNTNGLMPTLKSETDIYAVLIGDVYKDSLRAIDLLRTEGVSVAVDNSGRKPASQIKQAVKKQIKYALFIGEQEISDERYVLKDLDSGQEHIGSMERIASIVLDSRIKS